MRISNFLLKQLLSLALFLTAETLFAANNVYVTNFNADTVTVINADTETIVATVTVGVQPVGVAVRPDGAFAYVGNSENGVSGSVSVISALNFEVVATV